MVTRWDIIKILKEHETREAKREAVETYVKEHVLTEEHRAKILDDLESYAEY